VSIDNYIIPETNNRQDKEIVEVNIRLTDECNLQCKTCPLTRTNRSAAPAEHEYIARIKTLPSCVKHITLTGGEPLLRREMLLNVIETIMEVLPQTRIQLLTNGLGFADSDFALSIVARSKNSLRIGIPIYGPTASLHDNIVGLPGAYERLNRAISNITDAGGTVDLRVVVSRLNAAVLPDIAGYVTTTHPNIDRILFMGLEMRGIARHYHQEIWSSPREHHMLLESAIMTCVRERKRVALYNYPLCTISDSYWSLCKDSITKSKKHFLPECNYCLVKNYCCGTFFSNRRLAANYISPIR